MPIFALCYLMGVLTSAFMPKLLSVFHLLLLALVALTLLLYVLRSHQERVLSKYSERLLQSLKGALVLVLSFCLSSLHGHWLLERQYDDQRYARDCQLQGVVIGLPDIAKNYTRFEFKLKEASCAQQKLPLSKVALSLYNADIKLRSGDRLVLTVRLKAVRSQYSDGAFDRQLNAINNGINATGYVREIHHREPDFSWRSGLRDKIRQWLNSFVVSEQAKASLRALILGDKSGITDRQWQQLRITGTVHLLVVSGLHIGIMVAIGWWICFGLRALLQLCGVIRGVIYLPQVGALLLSLGYVIIAGASLSTQRAWLMALVMIAGQWLSLKPNLWQRWWWALLIIISWQPLSVMQPGLWLSFLAVASLISLQGYRSNNSGIVLIIKSQLWVWLALMPLLLLFFGQVSLLSPLVNIFAISFVSLLLLLLPLALSLQFFSVQWLIQWIATALDYFWEMQAFLAQHGQFMLLKIEGLSAATIVLLALSCLALMLPLGKRVKALCVICWLLFVYPTRSLLPEQVAFRLTLIDVGQGLSVLVQTPSKNLLFDTGAAFNSGFSYYNGVVKPLLNAQAIRQLDLVVISHSDNDHSGGLEDVIAHLPIAQLVLGMPKSTPVDNSTRATTLVKICQSGKRWVWDNVVFHYRHPEAGGFIKNNNQSCVLELGTPHCKVLITADAEAALERQLLASTFQASDRVLVVGHHGSNTSSTADFLAGEQFSKALLSSGYRNRYGHPHPKVLKRLKAAGVPLFRTDQLGSIEVLATAQGCVLSSHKARYQRYWW